MGLHADVQQMHKMLGHLDKWLEEAIAYAKEREFEPDVLIDARLYPDMYTFVQQVRAAADSAKFAGARLAGVEPPKHPDEEKTLEECRERVGKAQAFLETLEADAVDSGATRKIKLPFLPEDKVVLGDLYFREFAQPNFYFHLITAYGVLRKSGVLLGKRKFIGGMTLEDA